MKILSFFFVSICLYSTHVASRSLPHRSEQTNSGLEVLKAAMLKPKGKELVFWTKFKSILRGVRTDREGSNSGNEGQSFVPSELHSAHKTQHFKENIESSNGIVSNLTISLQNEHIKEKSEIQGTENSNGVVMNVTNSLEKEHFTENGEFQETGTVMNVTSSLEKEYLRSMHGFQETESSNETVWNEKQFATESLSETSERNDSVGFDGNRNTFSNDTTLNEISVASHELNMENGSFPVLQEMESANFSDTVVLNFLNFTDKIFGETLFENVTVDSLDETSIMREGGEIAFFQEMSTSGFELLIDSETTRNFYLTELLSSQSVLTREEDNGALATLFSDDDDPTLEAENFNLNESNNAEINASWVGEQTRASFDIGSGAEELETEKNALNKSSIPVKENEQIVEQTSASFDIERGTEQFEIEKNALNKSDIPVKGNEQIEEIPSLCPSPGFCIFWFIAQDTCAIDSHCLGSRICCKLGCSKTCIEI